MNPRRLYRSRYDRQLAGVAAGMAEYLDLDPTLVRILWILSVLFGGFTILLYVILAFVIPLAPVATAPGGPGAPDSPAEPGAGAPAQPADGAIEGWTTSPGWTGNAAWSSTAAAGAGAPRGAGAGFYAGILLVVFGAIALANTVIPGWAGAVAIGPALLVALGAALLIRSMRRTADES